MKVAVVVILTLLLRQTTFSQTNSDTVNIKEVQVRAKRIPKAYKITRFDSLSINESETLAMLLQENSPVFVKTYGLGSLATVSFRGTGASHTKVLWNDISLNSPMNGQVDFSLYPTLFFDNAALHHGASALIDGNGALGGSINISNTPSFNKGFRTQIKQSIGSFNAYVTAAKFHFSNKNWFTETQIYYKKAKNDFDYVNITLQDQATLTQNKAKLKQYGFQQAIYKKLKTGNIGIRLWYFNSDRDLPPTMQINLNDEKQKDESLRALVEWTGLIKNLKYKWVNALVKDKLIYTNNLAKINSKNDSYLLNSKLFTKYYLKYKFVLTNDISIRYEQAKADGYKTEHTRYNNTWLLGLSKHFKRFNINIFNRFTQIEKNTQFIVPSIGLNYGFFKHQQLQLKANAGINYNYPTFNDLYWNPGGNSELKPERAEMIELGLSYKHTINQTSLAIETSSFYSKVDDWIIWQPTSTGLWSPDNLKEVENKGIELSLHLKTVIQKLTIKANANYSYTASTNKKSKNQTDLSVNKQLIYIPFHQFNYNLNILFKSYRVSYNYSYTGKRFISSDNNWYLPDNFISTISVNKKIKIRDKSTLNASFKINNLLNQDYQSIAWRPMPKRNYLFTLTFQFN